MKKYTAYATLIKNLEATVEAASLEEAEKMFDQMISDDFFVQGAEFTMDNIAEQVSE
jgi:pentatricopeptide repeat protein